MRAGTPFAAKRLVSGPPDQGDIIRTEAILGLVGGDWRKGAGRVVPGMTTVVQMWRATA